MAFIDEAVIVASKYADFLKVTLPFTMRHIKRPFVVTSDEPFDDPVREVCRMYGVDCLSTNLLYNNGSMFAKGRAINRGLDMLGQYGWVAHIDADIILPEQTSRMLERLDLDQTCIHGVDRVACPTAVDFRKYVEDPTQYKWHCLLETHRDFRLMGRYIHDGSGYCPIGYFQLWHGRSPRTGRNIRYPETGNEAIHADVQHALQWDRCKRVLIPEIIAIHLDSCDSPLGANWSGRKTPEFDPRATTVPSKSHVKGYFSPEYDLVGNPNERR